MSTYAELERRTDGFISQDEKDRADGLDPALMEAMGAVKFWRERVESAAEALESWVACQRADVEAEVHARRRVFAAADAALARAEAHLQLLYARTVNRRR